MKQARPKAGDPNLWYAKTLLNNIPIDKRALIRWYTKKICSLGGT